jgi:Fe-S-cluster containining protein
MCCSVYGAVTLSMVEARAIADHLAVPFDHFAVTYTVPVPDHPDQRMLARQPDPIGDPVFGSCVFLDLSQRRCTVYEARPSNCRDWPKREHQAPGAEGRCCYYDVLEQARRELKGNGPGTPIPLIQIRRLVDDGK